MASMPHDPPIVWHARHPTKERKTVSNADQKQTLLADYEIARRTLEWLADNNRLTGVSHKQPGWTDTVEELARQFAAGPGKADGNYRRKWLDALLAIV